MPRIFAYHCAEMLASSVESFASTCHFFTDCPICPEISRILPVVLKEIAEIFSPRAVVEILSSFSIQSLVATAVRTDTRFFSGTSEQLDKRKVPRIIKMISPGQRLVYWKGGIIFMEVYL